MKNIEKYAKEILGFACSVNDRMAVRKATMRTIGCSGFSCGYCLFGKADYCNEEMAKWAESEYIEQPKISRKDRAFLDYLKGYKCVARDNDGKLYAYISIPKKLLACACWGADDECKSLARLDIDFPMVKWSDAEPCKIDDLKKLEVVDSYE